MYKQFMGKSLSPKEISRFAVLGWAIEWMQAWLLMADDIMDDSKTRRGQPCWYLNEDVQKIAINDAFFVEVKVTCLFTCLFLFFLFLSIFSSQYNFCFKNKSHVDVGVQNVEATFRERSILPPVS
jgi:geranylgeranyl pyrophosphate synthase